MSILLHKGSTNCPASHIHMTTGCHSESWFCSYIWKFIFFWYSWLYWLFSM